VYRQPKIGYVRTLLGIQHDVRRFQVPMDKAFGMSERNRLGNGRHQTGRLCEWRGRFLGTQEFSQVLPVDVFLDDEHVFAIATKLTATILDPFAGGCVTHSRQQNGEGKRREKGGGKKEEGKRGHSKDILIIRTIASKYRENLTSLETMVRRLQPGVISSIRGVKRRVGFATPSEFLERAA
jgi:hypothetical protein